MTIARRLARPLLASGFVLGGINGFRQADALRDKAQKVTDKVVPLAEQAVQKAVPALSLPRDPVTLVRANAVAQVVAGASLAAGRAPRLSAAVLAASIVPTTVAGHRFWEETDDVAKNTQRLQFAKNLSMLGGLLLAVVDTEGQPGLAWRARRAARDLRREAGHQRTEAVLGAKLKAASLT